MSLWDLALFLAPAIVLGLLLWGAGTWLDHREANAVDRELRKLIREERRRRGE